MLFDICMFLFRWMENENYFITECLEWMIGQAKGTKWDKEGWLFDQQRMSDSLLIIRETSFSNIFQYQNLSAIHANWLQYK